MKVQWRLSGLGSVLWAGMGLAVLLLAGCATPQDPVFRSAPPGAGGPAGGSSSGVRTDLFSIGDQVMVVFSDGNLPQHDARIKEDGTITLHLVGAVKAAGKTAGELQKEIHDLYVPKYYQPGRLTVTVKSQERVYYVGGEVRNPNRYAYTGATTVTKAIQAAGDFTDYANKKKVRLTRADGKTIVVNCKKVLDGHPELDPIVFSDDKIHVPRRFW